MIDTDEFLFSPRYGNLKAALQNYRGYSGVVANWVFYGTSNYILLPGQKMTDHLLYRQKIIPGKPEPVKSIVKPRYVVGGFIHRFDYSQGFSVNENHQRIDGFDSPISVEIFRINHYWARDINFFLNVKVPRRAKWDKTTDYVITAEREMNAEYDEIARKFN